MIATIRAGRFESPLNSRLSEVVPHVYGGVLAYAMYVLARLLIELQTYLVASTPPTTDFLSPTAFGSCIAIYLCMMVFMVQDIGEITKVSHSFPMLRTSRYSHELLIASTYLAAFAMLEKHSSVSWIFFGFAVGFGGLWCNQLKEEYPSDSNGMRSLATTLKTLQYIGACLFIGEGGVLLIQRGPILDVTAAVCFAATFAIWCLFYAFVPAILHGDSCNAILVPILVPDTWVIWWQKKRRHFGFPNGGSNV